MHTGKVAEDKRATRQRVPPKRASGKAGKVARHQQDEKMPTGKQDGAR